MNKETLEALQRLLHLLRCGGSYDKKFWDDIGAVEMWMEEEEKEHLDEE